MSSERAVSRDAVYSGLIAGTKAAEGALALGKFSIQCFDKDGNLKWEDTNHNLVVNAGIQYMCGTGLTATAQITNWYIGLYGAAASNNPAAGDTLASHAGWTEITPYSGNRLLVSWTAATNANPSVAASSTPVSFSITSSDTVGGAFLCSAASGTSGTLFSAADFQAPGDRTVANGDTLNVSYSFSLSAS